jgi:PAS domain S-box-containing protein
MLAKILVADDSTTDRLIIKNTLSEYCVLTACDGLEAMRKLDEHADIDLLILDLDMPNMDGFQLLSNLKSDDRYKKLRIIILTNYDEIDKEIKGLKLGAVDYVRKPVNMDSLKVRIDIHIELLRTQQLLEHKLDEQGMTFDTIFQQAPIGIAISHSDEPFVANSSNFTSVNSIFEQITGRTKEEIIKLGWVQITHPDDVEADLKNFKKLQSGEIKNYSMEKRYIKPDGSIVWVYMVVAPLNLLNEHKYNHICLVHDITKRKAMEADLLESERSKSVLLSHLPGMAYRCNYDREWTMQFVSAGCFELTGYTSENLLSNRDLSFNDVIAPEYRDSLWKEWERILSNRLPFKYEYEIITANGKHKWVLEMGEGIYDEQGKAEALEGIILDISNRKEIENYLRYNNEHDTWTGLHNRRHLENLLRHDAKTSASEKRAVVSINLSTMHSLSMVYGFHYSQELVKKVAEALKLHCTDKCQLFNTYEKRFAFYLKAYKDKNELIKFCESVANTLESLLAIERIGGGIGIIEIDEDNENNIDQLLKNLLIASEKAINTIDRDISFCFFNTDMEMQIIREEEIKHELAKIAEDENNNSLFLQFQPILDLGSNQINGFEALARINSDKFGLIPPMEFIPVAEKTKLIIPIGKKIIIQAFRFLNTLNERGHDRISISINISAIQLLRNDFVKNLVEMINEMQVNPENIILEITESMFASNYYEINKILGELNVLGIKIAIDDFGTGYSSLARERELNINCLKIDKYFIDKLLTLNDEEAITGDIISMAHKLGHYVVAEGVEHERQRQYLMNCGCEKIQGYLVGKPLDEEVAIELLTKN